MTTRPSRAGGLALVVALSVACGSDDPRAGSPGESVAERRRAPVESTMPIVDDAHDRDAAADDDALDDDGENAETDEIGDADVVESAADIGSHGIPETSVEERLLATFPDWHRFFDGPYVDCGTHLIPGVRIYAFDPSGESFVDVYSDADDAEAALQAWLAMVDAASFGPVECGDELGNVIRLDAPSSTTRAGDRWIVERTIGFGAEGPMYTNTRELRRCGDSLIWEDVETPGLTAPLGC